MTSSTLDTTTTGNSKQRYDEFVAALEHFGPTCSFSGKVWEQMSAKLGWSENEVKQYAFKYFMFLERRGREQPISVVEDYPITTTNNIINRNNMQERNLPQSSLNTEVSPKNSLESEWTDEECILFNTLLFKHPSEVDHRWERIAAMVPGKSALQVEKRFLFLQQEK